MSKIAPGHPCGQFHLPAGRAAQISAVAATHDAGQLAARIASIAAPGEIGPRIAAISPRPVPRGAAGAATIFASTPTAGTPGCSNSSSGPHENWAARATENGKASMRGSRNRLRNQCEVGAANNRMPRVAATESANPACSACQGSNASKARIARPSAGSAVLRLPPNALTSSTAAITAARSTEESGPTTTTNAASAAPAASARILRPAPRRDTHQVMVAMTSPVLLPDTAVRWLRELSSIRSPSASGTSEVSPTAKPGTSSASGTSLACSTRSARKAAAAEPSVVSSPSL